MILVMKTFKIKIRYASGQSVTEDQGLRVLESRYRTSYWIFFACWKLLWAKRARCFFLQVDLSTLLALVFTRSNSSTINVRK
jgi:hypothetical protein